MHRKPANFYPKSRVIRSQFSQPSSQVGVACRVDGRHKDLVEVKARWRSKWLADGKWQTLIKHGTQELLTRDLGSSKNRVPKIPWLLFMFPCLYIYVYICSVFNLPFLGYLPPLDKRTSMRSSQEVQRPCSKSK